MQIHTVTQDPFLFIKSLDDGSNVDLKSEQSRSDSLEAELSIKTQEIVELKKDKKKLAAYYSHSKINLYGIENKLSSSIELLASSRSKLCSEYSVKLDAIEKKLCTTNEMISSLYSKLSSKVEKQFSIKTLPLPDIQSDNLLEIKRLNEEKGELTEMYSETKVKDDCNMLASLQSQTQLNSQSMEKTSEKDMLDTYYKVLSDDQKGLYIYH